MQRPTCLHVMSENIIGFSFSYKFFFFFTSKSPAVQIILQLKYESTSVKTYFY